jgi:tRNA-dihydrouridine synthase B
MTTQNSPEICLAPLRGLTDSIFRNTYATFFSGIDWAVTPFLTTVKGSRIKASHLREVLPENNQRLPVVPQILSKSADNFIPLAIALYEMGYGSINWNLGCPYPMVARKKRGSGLLPHPDLVDGFLERVLNTIPNRLSIKLRLGYHDTSEIKLLLPILNRYPLDCLIIHPRTGKQMYDGRPDESAFEACLGMTSHSVVYNGDIVTKGDMDRMQSRFPSIGTWMIGRGILADPFLPGRIKKHTTGQTDEIDHFRKFHDALMSAYGAVLFGPGHLLNRMKGFWYYFCQSFDDGSRLLKKIRRTRTLDHYQETLEKFFLSAPKRKNAS